MKLWRKAGARLDAGIERYTVGKDHRLDLELLPFDLQASAAHAKMLRSCGYLSRAELGKLLRGLREAQRLHARGRFPIRPQDEDCHTAIENFLTRRLGAVGGKIHTARSRNDQALTALRLLMKARLQEIGRSTRRLQAAIAAFAARCAGLAMPGYTHMRKAMPTTVDTLALAWRDMLEDDLLLLRAVLAVLDKSPLGSAAGFGVPLRIDRKRTAKELGFAAVQENPIHCANSRARYEALAVQAVYGVMKTLNRAASDLALFTMSEFGFFRLAPQHCTGSSIMPHKRNPDVLELVRAQAHAVRGYLLWIDGLTLDRPSGYHRDYQLAKEPLLESLRIAAESLEIMEKVVSGLTADPERLAAAMTEELYATEKACRLVEKGVPFRRAYRMVAEGRD